MKLGKVIPPKIVVWDATRRCNLNCEHCGAKEENYKHELTTMQVKQFIKLIAEYGIQTFTVTGGEPLLRRDLFDIFQFAKGKGLQTGMASNGFLIDKSNADKIAYLFDSVQISIDGSEKTHNKIRKNNFAYDRTLNAIKLLKKNKARQITISSVITPSNINELDKIAKIIGPLKINIWKITTVMPVKSAKKIQKLHLNIKQFEYLLKFVEKNKNKLKIQFGENIGYLGRDDGKVRNIPFFCPVGFLSCCLGTDGKIRGCPEEPDNPYFYEGNILNEDFKIIWEKGFKKYRNQGLVDSNCRNCSYVNDCRGGCWVMKTGNLNCAVKKYCL